MTLHVHAVGSGSAYTPLFMVVLSKSSAAYVEAVFLSWAINGKHYRPKPLKLFLVSLQNHEREVWKN